MSVCPYCSDGARTGLPLNACENCMNTGEIEMSEIEAMVSDNGEGDKVTLVIPPELRQWQHFAISPDDALVLAAKLTRAANLATANHVGVDL